MAFNVSDADHIRLIEAYNRVKRFPEEQPDGFISLIELRNLVGDLLKYAPRPGS